LESHHKREQGVWLVTFKKHDQDKHVSYEEIVEEATCVGWIDSLPRRLDDERIVTLLVPEVMRKIGEGKADRSWTFLGSIEGLEIPRDPGAEWDRYDNALVNFEAIPSAVLELVAPRNGDDPSVWRKPTILRRCAYNWPRPRFDPEITGH
jgi:hypothetical protein